MTGSRDPTIVVLTAMAAIALNAVGLVLVYAAELAQRQFLCGFGCELPPAMSTGLGGVGVTLIISGTGIFALLAAFQLRSEPSRQERSTEEA